MAASGGPPLPSLAFAEDDEAACGSYMIGYQLDALVGSLQGPGAVSASVLDIASGSWALPREAFAEDEKAVEAGQGYVLAENANSSTRQF